MDFYANRNLQSLFRAFRRRLSKENFTIGSLTSPTQNSNRLNWRFQILKISGVLFQYQDILSEVGIHSFIQLRPTRPCRWTISTTSKTQWWAQHYPLSPPLRDQNKGVVGAFDLAGQYLEWRRDYHENLSVFLQSGLERNTEIQVKQT